MNSASGHAWTPEDRQRASLYGTCQDCRFPLDARSRPLSPDDVCYPGTVTERFCPDCGVVR